MERPIIFSGESVRAILSGSKTQTRRIVRPALPAGMRSWGEGLSGDFAWTDHPHQGEKGHIEHRRCPYGEPGDFLWVREAFHPCGTGTSPNWRSEMISYRADNGNEELEPFWGATVQRLPAPVEWQGVQHIGWHSPLYMPRWASRITLEVTGVHVERLQTIGYLDCIAEGVQDRGPDGQAYSVEQLRSIYSRAWDSLNARRGYPWESNPWVWVLEFRRVTP